MRKLNDPLVLAILASLAVTVAGVWAEPAAGQAPVHGSEDHLAERARLLARSIERSPISIRDLLTEQELIEMGEDLFFQETFGGNGRTCGTCHLTEDDFGLIPETVASLPTSDPLFIAELDPDLTDLEHPPLMRSARALILENIDGFDEDPVFRNSPHFLNIVETAPYGLSGEFADLQVFTVGAVMQHFPKTLARQEGVDFRLPTAEELVAMEAFMNSVDLPADRDFTLENFVTTVQQRRGSDLFFGTAKCSQCHNGPVLADAVASLGGGNQNFNTGVVNLRINQENQPENPDGGPLPPEDRGLREFNTPALIGVARTAPFFHDHSVATLAEAVEFYDGPEFNASPGGTLVGGIELLPAATDDLTVFLESLDERPFEVAPASVGFGARDLVSGPTPSVTVTLTETGSDPVTVISVGLAGGPHDDQFVVTPTSATEVQVTFDPSTLGPKSARLEFKTDGGDFGVPLRGVGFSLGSASFADVPPTHAAFQFVEAIFKEGVTAGCGGGNFCPGASVSRAQLAVMLAVAMGVFDVPPRHLFSDLPPTVFASGFVERLAGEGVTAGCGGGAFCPGDVVTRAQAAVLLVAATERSPVDPATGIFVDVPPGSFGAGFIERLALDGDAAGCGGGNFCPDDPLTRAAAAVLIARAFGLAP